MIADGVTWTIRVYAAVPSYYMCTVLDCVIKGGKTGSLRCPWNFNQREKEFPNLLTSTLIFSAMDRVICHISPAAFS